MKRSVKKQSKIAPRFKAGDKVTAPGFDSLINTPDKVLEIESSFWNGFAHMYYFKDHDMGLGQPYLVLHSTLS